MSIPVLYPLNDFAFIATVRVANASGALVALETGTPTAFLATSDSPTATAADATLQMTPTYTGTGGKWLVSFDASVLTPALLATLFGSATPYVILQFTGAVRVVVECAYLASRTIDVA
jgi:hypothetical protein